MIVRCFDASFAPCACNPDLRAYLLTDDRALEEHSEPLAAGEDYLVAALAFGPFVPWFSVVDRFGGLRYPILAPGPLFSIRDSRFSRLWERGTAGDRLGGEHTFLAPGIWARDPLFDGRMFEGEAEPLQLMEQWTRTMMLEWPLPWITERAVLVGEENWVTDEDWAEQWEADPRDAMTIHPKTGKLLHNPLFPQDKAGKPR